jgi:hypothetical protein
LASIDPQIAFANEVVAAMKNHLTENRALIGMRRRELSWRRQRGSSSRLKQVFRFGHSRVRRPAETPAVALPRRWGSFPLAPRELFL